MFRDDGHAGHNGSLPALLPKLLVVDDEPGVLKLTERFGRAEGFEVSIRGGGLAALAAFPELHPDVALVDLRMPGMTGLDVLRSIREADPDCQVILMTGAPTVDTAIDAVRAGAIDYLSKPLDLPRLRGLLVSVRERIERRERLLRVDAETARQFEFHGMVGRGPTMQDLFDLIRRLAPHVRTVLITGETGTGKELVAHALHQLGPRHARRMVPVNCSAIVETLFESELFGYVRGAFTGATDAKAGMFEHADGGTLFLDEAGELPLTLQAKLLRAVEQGEVRRIGSLDRRQVDVHVIAATNRDLRAEVAAGRFRSDLFYRLSTIEVHLPPLRARREDIPYLAAHFVRDLATRLARPATGLTPAAERLLQNAPWPGNIRELRNTIERACIVSSQRILTERDIHKAMGTASLAPLSAPLQADTSTVRSRLLSTAQRDQIAQVLADVGGNKTEAAHRLGVSRRSLYRWMDRLKIEL